MTNEKQEALRELEWDFDWLCGCMGGVLNLPADESEAVRRIKNNIETIRAALSTIPEPVIAETPAGTEIRNTHPKEMFILRTGVLSSNDEILQEDYTADRKPFRHRRWGDAIRYIREDALTAQQPVRGGVNDTNVADPISAASDDDKQWLILSHGLYFRPNSRGYTGIRDEAGRYTEEKAKSYSDAEAIHVDNAPEFLPEAHMDLVIAHLKKQRDEARKALSATPAEAPKVDVKNKFNIGDIVNVREGYKFSEWEKEDLIITAVRWDRKKDTILYDGAVVGEPLHYGDTTDFEESDLVKKSEG